MWTLGCSWCFGNGTVTVMTSNGPAEEECDHCKD